MDEKAADLIREYAGTFPVDDIGFASADEYSSPRSPDLRSIFPDISSIVVMAYRELSTCTSDNMQIAMNGRLDLMEYSRSCNYKLANFIESRLSGRAMTVPVSYPLPMTKETQGAVADVSMRHAAVAAGLAEFGRNNCVLHPRLGSRVIFTAVLTDLDLPPAKERVTGVCDDCGLCVDACPSGALDEEGRTDVMKCLKVCQPFGMGGNIKFWSKALSSTGEEATQMLLDDRYWRLLQAGSIGFQYFCFNCIRECPAGSDR